MAVDLVAGERRVDGPVPHERDGASFTSTSFTVGFDVALGQPLDERLAEGERLRHVRGDAELEDRRRPGLGEPPGDRLANGRELDDLDLAAAGGAGATAAGGPAARPGRGVRSTSSARMRPSGPVPVIEARSTPALARDPAGERARLDADRPGPAPRGRAGCFREAGSVAAGLRLLGGLLRGSVAGCSAGRGPFGFAACLGSRGSASAGPRPPRRLGALAVVVDHGDGRPDLDLALGDDDLLEDAVDLRPRPPG